jgi:hypothetical protein
MRRLKLARVVKCQIEEEEADFVDVSHLCDVYNCRLRSNVCFYEM